jgi:hypothetical protein
MLIDKGVVDLVAAINVSEAIAELNALLHLVATDLFALLLSRRGRSTRSL